VLLTRRTFPDESARPRYNIRNGSGISTATSFVTISVSRCVRSHGTRLRCSAVQHRGRNPKINKTRFSRNPVTHSPPVGRDRFGDAYRAPIIFVRDRLSVQRQAIDQKQMAGIREKNEKPRTKNVHTYVYKSRDHRTTLLPAFRGVPSATFPDYLGGERDQPIGLN